MALQGSEETGLGSIPTAAGADSPGETPPAGVTQIIPGTGIGVAPPGGTGAVTVTNEGVTQLLPGAGIGLSAATGSVTVTNTDPASAQTLQAAWTIANTRWYAVDGVNGNDSNVGFSDTSSADSGTKAKKTLAALGAIFPRIGAGRKVVVGIASGTYTDGLDVILGGVSGYATNFPLIVGTATNSTAGAVAFQGDANDRIFAGAVTATGLNAAGYQPIGTPTQSTIQCALVGGAAPNFPAEPADPLGCRVRFDAATATVALRNACVPVIGVTTTTTTNDTLLLTFPATGSGGLPAVPTTSDTFYIEKPGVTTGQTFLVIGDNAAGPGSVATNALTTQVVGWNCGTNCRINGPGRLFLAFCRFAFLATNNSELFNTSPFYRDEVAQRFIGPTKSNGISSVIGPMGWNQNSQNTSFVVAGGLTVGFCLAFNFPNGSYCLGLGLIGSPMAVDDPSNQPLAMLGARVANSQSASRIAGATLIQAKTAGFNLVESSCTIAKLTITGCAANPAIAIQGSGCGLSVSSFLTGSTGNTDVGLDLTVARNAMVLIVSAPTVTGSLGDVRLADGTIITWATAMAGVVDTSGNRLFAPGNAPDHPIAVATGAVAVAITNAPAGSPATPARYVKFPDGAGGFYTFPSLT